MSTRNSLRTESNQAAPRAQKALRIRRGAAGNNSRWNFRAR